MSNTLFDIVGEFKQLYEMFTDPEVDEQTIADTLEAVKGELEVKSEGYIHVIKQLEMERDKAAEMAEFWAEKKAIRDNSVKRLKNTLCTALVETNNEKGIQAGDYTLKAVGNGGKQAIEYTADVPNAYQRVVYEPDTERIRKDLESGKKLPFAVLKPRGKHLAIR